MSTKKYGVDQQLIRDLASILDETNLTEIEVEQDDLRIRVSRTPAAVQAFAPAAAPAPAPVAAARRLLLLPQRRRGRRLQNAVLSPMVGTAYLALGSGAPRRSSPSASR